MDLTDDKDFLRLLVRHRSMWDSYSKNIQQHGSDDSDREEIDAVHNAVQSELIRRGIISDGISFERSYCDESGVFHTVTESLQQKL